MKWLDEILEQYARDYFVLLQPHTKAKEELKDLKRFKAEQAILSHIEEALGEDDPLGNTDRETRLVRETRNELRAELRAKLLKGKDE